MSWFSRKETKTEQFETVLQRLVAAAEGMTGYVNPETCLQAPTVQSIVTAISRRISITPVHVYQTSESNGKEIKEKLPNHPIAKLLRSPNSWQSQVDYWQDLTSSLVRHGKYFAIKGQGQTGPIRTIDPINAKDVAIEQNENTGELTFKYHQKSYPQKKVHYIRGPARDYVTGDSPVDNIKTAIGLEIACEEFGASFFNNGAMPLMMFSYKEGSKGFRNPEDEKKFVEDFQNAFSGAKRHKAMLTPQGLEVNASTVENEKAQFIETRKFNQTVIAGAWNVPPHLVGNLENGTYNNVEQQDKDFTLNVIMPYIKAIESAMERDLLTDKDRNNGIVIRFNMDATLRADFKTRMEGYATQIQHAMLTPNGAVENEGRNPSTDPVADKLFRSANLVPADQETAEPDEPIEDEPTDEDEQVMP